ncbi:PREDICTED: centromere protein Q-like [Thamnophis sirtalis]|uniref:Centromere protein Q n=1 Tax=Thamnophis sirtalis TaxID=35019 RepID=A0A6I9Z5X8_9SAUR|nr:PREDICTED: centromere protein Q-like [Thamnophis sirtalis]
MVFVETESPETKPKIVSSKQKVKCQRLPKNIKKSLESKIHWTIIAILYEITQDYNETEKHLNNLKERLLKCIATLEVPVDELNYLSNVQKVLKEENKKYILMEEGLQHLEEEITKDVSTLHTVDEKMQILQKKIKALKHELAALETEADQLFHRDTKHDLGLPGLSVEYFKLPTLQNEILKIGNPHALLDDMNIIQQSDEMKNMMGFLEQLYEKADHRCTEEQ